MLSHYKTVRQFGREEIVIKRSRFIGFAAPVNTEEEAIRFIESIRKEHGTATHNCSAYVVGERDEFQKFSDDGEPNGTAGKPILEVIKNNGMKNTVVVVTRYFGGIMLGAGGLVRAYTDGAVAGITAAGPVYQVLHREVWMEIDYTWHGKVENELKNNQILQGETQFADKVTLCCLPLEGDKDAFIVRMTDVTQGQATLTLGEAKYIIHEQCPEKLRKG